MSWVSSNWRRSLGADAFDVPAGRLDLVAEHPSEMTRTHGRTLSQFADAVRAPGSASMASCTRRIEVRLARGIRSHRTGSARIKARIQDR